MHQRSWILASFFFLFASLGYLPFSIPSAFASHDPTLAWDPNTESDLKGYNLYIGTQTGIYNGPNSPTFVDKAFNSTSVENLQEGETYYFALTAVDFSGNESEPSTEVSQTIPLPGPDTIAPTITLTTPANGATVAGTITVAALATDNIHVLGVQFQLDGATLGAEDTTNDYQVVWDTSTFPLGTYTLTTIARDAAGNTTTSAPITITVTDPLEVSNVTVTSGRNYQVIPNGLQPGAAVYIDRAYTYTTVPTTLANVTYLQTANNDKNSSGASFLSFDTNQSVTVYVAHDQRIFPKPAWLAAFIPTGDALVTTDTTLDLFSRSFPGGTITLGGNHETTGSNSMYTVTVVGQGGAVADTTPPSAPTIQQALADSASQVTVSWTAATDDVGVTAYTLYRNGTPSGTTSTLSYVDTGLTTATTYAYTVTAHDAAGNESTPSVAASVTTLVIPDTTPPTTPTIQQAQADSASQVTVSWTASTDDIGVTAYTLSRNGTAISTTPTLNYVDNGLAAATTYAYTVTALDAAGNESTPSAAASVITLTSPDTTPPSAPTIQQALADSASQITVSWTAATDDIGVTAYTLSRNGTAIGTTPTLNYVDNGLAAATTYAYTVTALDAAGNESIPSAAASVTTLALPDTQAPTVTLTAPTNGATVSGSVTVAALAADNVGVLGVQFQLNGTNLGSEDTTNDYQVVWDTSTLALGTYTLTAIARDATGNATAAAPITVTVTDTPPTLEISNVTVTSGQTYQIIPNGLQPGAAVYIDRAYTYKTVPTTLTNVTYLQTANNDKNSSGPSFLSFDANQLVTVYVGHDNRITPKPAWLTAFTPTGETLVTTDVPLDLFSRSFPAGTITLGGNNASTSGQSSSQSMYTVVVVGQGGAVADTTSPSAPTIQQALADSASQVTVSWTAATDDVGVTAYTLYRNGTPSGTTANLSYVDSGLTAATTYAYTVTALDAAGNESTPSAAASVTTLALTDTQAPTVTLTAPTHGATVTGFITVAALAFDSVGVLGVQFQLDGTNLGPEDTTNDYQTVWDTSTVAPGAYTLTAIAHDAAGNSTTAAPITVTVTESPLPLKLSNLTATTGQAYQIIPNGLQPGATAYIDRSYTYTTVPTTLTNVTYLQTANDDKYSSGPSFLSFEVNQSVTVYVAHDTRITPKPAWLAAFTKTGEALVTTDTALDLFSRSFPTGTITLDGNHETTSGKSMYTIVVVGQDGTVADTTPPSTHWADYTAFMSPITSEVKGHLRSIVAVGEANGRVLGRMGQVGDSITNSFAFFRNGILQGPSGNETNHDYSDVRSWLAYGGSQPADLSSFYADHGKGTDYGNDGGWTLNDAAAANHPFAAVDVGNGLVPGEFSWGLIMFGTNDIDDPSWDAQVWKADYVSFVQEFINLGVVPVLSTIPPEEEHIGDGRVELANDQIRSLATELNIPYVDFYALVLHYQPVAWVGTLIGNDGTHPSAGGGGRDFSQDGLTSNDGYAARTKLTWDMAEKLKKIVFEDGAPEAPPTTNQPPLLNPIGNQIIAEGATLTLLVSASDPDGDAITLSVQNLPPFGTFTDNGSGAGTLDLTPGFNDAGVYPNVIITADDGGGTPTYETFTITVSAVADTTPPPPPTIQQALANSASQITVSWAPATDQAWVGVESHVSIPDPSYCPALPQPGSGENVITIGSGDVEGLLSQLSTAIPGTTLLLEDGIYQLNSDQSLEIGTPGLTLRSASGNREAVRIEGGYNNISVNVDEFTVADVTLSNPRWHNIQVRGEQGVSGTQIYNVHLLDAGQQFVKVSSGDGSKGKFADDGLVACSQIEYTTYAPSSYTNEVDILAGKGWVIRDNVFRRIRSQAGPAGPAILVWRNAIDTVIRRNLIIDSWRGIALGLSSPDTHSRGGANVVYDHQNGLVENNVILALHERADAAIENNYARNSQVLHNTVYYHEGLNHIVNWSIEYRFPPTTAVIKNNLTNFPILSRTPFAEQEAEIEANVTEAEENWFQDILAEDYHLIPGAPVILQVAPVTGNQEVAAYTLYRNGIAVGTTPNLTYTDTDLTPVTTYAYTVTALDAASNESAPSPAASVTTLALPDTTAPSITLTAPANGATVAGVVTVAATASDNVGVLGVQFQLNGTNLGPEDTTNDYQTLWDTSTVTPGTYTLTALARDAAGNATTSAPITVTVTDSPLPLEISNLTVTSGQAYQVIPNGLQPRAAAYIDRAYSYTTVATTLANVTYFQTANNDKNSSGPNFLSFEVNQPVTVYIAHDTRITPKPTWLTAFSPTGGALVTTDTVLDLFSRSFPAGIITLGGNQESTSGKSMYTVAVVGQGGTVADTTPPSTPSIQDALADSASQITVSWTAATDDVGVTAYTLYRNGTPSGTTANLSHVDTGLTAATTYAYTVTALDAAGNESTPSPAVSGTTLVLSDTTPPDTTPPSTPTIQQARADSASQITVTWTAATDDVGVTAYTLYRNGTPSGTTSTLSYVDTGLAAATTYAYTVTALDAAGNESTPSPVGSITTPSLGELPLFTMDKFVYEGAFRIKASSNGGSNPNYSQGPIAYNPKNHSIFFVGHAHQQSVAEYPIPELVKSMVLSDLNMSTTPIQVFADVLDKPDLTNRQDINRVGGMAVFNTPNGQELLINAYQYYDAAGEVTNTSLVIRDATNISGSAADGYFGFSGRAHTSRWLSPIPPEWQSILGGSWITGSSSGDPIIGRWPVGPTAFVFNPDDIIGNTNIASPVPTTKLLDFSLGNRLHDDLSNTSGTNDLWNHLSRAVYGFIIPGTSTYFTIGSNASITGEICYKKCDPDNGTSSGGYHASNGDYYQYYWLWDMKDLLKVKDGLIEPYDVRPYDYGDAQIAFGSEGNAIIGGTYDPVSGLLYLTVKKADREQDKYSNPPVIVAYSFDVPEPVSAERDSPAGTSDSFPPSTPTIQQAQADSAFQITVSWTAATDDVGVTAYTLSRNDTAIGTTPTLSYVDTGLAPATTYAFTVTALDAAGNESTPSAAASVTTLALPDTTAPSITLTAPANGATVAGVVTVTAAAADNVGVLGVQFQLNATNLGPEDTTNDYQTLWDTSTVTPGTYTLTALARDAAGNATTSAPITVTVTDSPLPLKISNLTVSSGRVYQVLPNGLQPGAITYIDRAYSYTTVATTLANVTYLQTANDDKNSNGPSFLSFEVNQSVTVYVAHDTQIIPKPAWLAAFSPTGGALVTTDTVLDLFSRSFPAGIITLGGNQESTSGKSMYTVAVVGQGGTVADTTPPSAPSIQDALADSASQITVSWTAATDDVGVTAYTLYRNGTPSGTTANLSHVDTGLTAATTYAYTVTALDAAGNESAPSTVTSATTHDNPPSFSGIATLSWQKNPERDLARFNVYHGPESHNYTVVLNVGRTSTPETPEYTVTSLPPGTYYFSVTAIDTSGNESAFSNEGTKTIP